MKRIPAPPILDLPSFSTACDLDLRHAAADIDPQLPSNPPYVVVFTPDNSDTVRPRLRLYRIDQESQLTLINTINIKKDKYFRMLPSSYGWVCLYTSLRSKILNPITQQTIPLPEFPDSDYCDFVGFGFHPKSKSHKLVRLLADSDSNLLFAHVLTLNTCLHQRPDNLSWRNIRGVACSELIRHNTSPVCADGLLYWETLPVRNGDHHILSILSFDLESEEFSYIASPPIRFFHRERYTVELQGKLCLVDQVLDGELLVVEIWMFNPNCRLWVKQYSLELMKDSLWNHLLPLWVQREDKILLCDDRNLYSYDLKNKSINKYNEVDTSSYWKPMEVLCVHSENLVS